MTRIGCTNVPAQRTILKFVHLGAPLNRVREIIGWQGTAEVEIATGMPVMATSEAQQFLLLVVDLTVKWRAVHYGQHFWLGTRQPYTAWVCCHTVCCY